MSLAVRANVADEVKAHQIAGVFGCVDRSICGSERSIDTLDDGVAPRKQIVGHLPIEDLNPGMLDP